VKTEDLPFAKRLIIYWCLSQATNAFNIVCGYDAVYPEHKYVDLGGNCSPDQGEKMEFTLVNGKVQVQK
jgi:hypothetical protein